MSGAIATGASCLITRIDAVAKRFGPAAPLRAQKHGASAVHGGTQGQVLDGLTYEARPFVQDGDDSIGTKTVGQSVNIIMLINASGLPLSEVLG